VWESACGVWELKGEVWDLSSHQLPLNLTPEWVLLPGLLLAYWLMSVSE